MKAIILAGGLGTRLKPFTEAIPKPLLPVGESSMLELTISRLKAHDFDEVFIATFYKADYIRSFLGDGSRLGVVLTVSKEEKPLGTCGPIKLLQDKLDEPFLVMNGDILTTIDFTKLYNYSEDVDSDFVVVTKEIVMPFEFGTIFSEGDYITGIEEKPDFKTEIVAGIYVLRPSILDMIPDNEYYGMDSLIKDMLKRGLPVAKYAMKEFWLDIGRIDDYQKAQDAYDTHFKENSSP